MIVPRSTIHKQKKEVFCSCFCIIMSSPVPSNISQNDTEILEKQWQEIQWRYKKEQQLLVQLEEVAKLRQTEHAAQKARREAEEKAQKEAERQRVAEEEDNGVPLMALERGFKRRGCPIGGS